MCIICGVPHAVALDLMGWADDKMGHRIWKKQPESPREIDQAIAVLGIQELGCHRYAGDDPAILKRTSAEYCDYPLAPQKNSLQVIRDGGTPPHLRPLGEEASFLAKVWKRLTKKNKE
jgi:hypothetical protein